MNSFYDLFYITEEGTFKPKGIIKEGKNLKTKYFETVEKMAASSIWELGYKEKRQRVEEIIVPTGVKRLAMSVFAHMWNLRKVVLPDSLEFIEYGAFEESSIERISIPDSVTKIEEGTFSSCHELVYVQLPSHLKEISERMFENCDNLTKIHLPETVTKIGSLAFWGCERLSHIFSSGECKNG